MGKIYTKGGDKGKTSLIGGTRVSKNNIRLDSYGTIDELNSQIGMIRSFPLREDLKEMIIFIQNKLFNCGGYLATDIERVNISNATTIINEDIQKIEEFIDKIDIELPPLTTFILPGGDPQVSACHISRTVCRRCERLIVSLSESLEIDNNIIVFINRLSDFLFMLARIVSQLNKTEEITWNTSCK